MASSGPSQIGCQHNARSIADAIKEDVVPPRFGEAAIADFLERAYALSGALMPLRSERDQLFRITEPSGDRFILRISPVTELRQTLEFQNSALYAVRRADGSLPIPTLKESVAGNAIETIACDGAHHLVRVLNYLPGKPIIDTGSTAAQRRSVGVMLARLDTALASFGSDYPGDPFLWNVAEASRLAPLVSTVAAPDMRALAGACLLNFEDRVKPHLARLPWQVIHNDFNPKNVLVDAANIDNVVGVIDFGDLIRNPRVVDLAVAIARQITDVSPLDDAAEIALSYNQILPLSGEEREILGDLTRARLAMRIVMWSWRNSMGDARATSDVIDGAFVRLREISQAASFI